MKTQQWNRFAGFNALANTEDLVCLSRTRWRWLDPRLRALLGMAAQHWRVFFVERTPTSWAGAINGGSAATQVIRVASTREGVWTVRPARMGAVGNLLPEERLLPVLRGFLDEAGIHEPVLWHLDASSAGDMDALPVWATLYLKPSMHTHACQSQREHKADAALRETSDALIDPAVLTLPAREGWNSVSNEIIRAACRRQHAPMAYLSAA